LMVFCLLFLAGLSSFRLMLHWTFDSYFVQQ
jgi:hypothetical protein